MKNTRFFLYGLLVLIAMMLWTTWQREHAPAQSIQQTQSSQQMDVQPSTDKPYSFHQNINHQVKKVTNHTIAQTQSDRIITVKTDLLNIQIDRLGGNIVHADLLKYSKSLKDKTPFVLMNQTNDHYYIAQSGLVLPNEDINHTPLLYTADQSQYTLNNNQPLIVTLKSKMDSGLTVVKQYQFQPNHYAVAVNYSLKNDSSRPWVGSEFMQFTRNITPLTSKSMFGFHSFFGVAVSSPDHPYQKYTFQKLSEESIGQIAKGGWVSMVQHYFLGAWVPDKNVKYRYYSKMGADELATAGMIGPKLEVQPGQTVQLNSNLYVGPKIEARLDQLSPKLWLTVDFGWLWFISIIIFKILKWINTIIDNWGWSIVILTILIKLAFYHLSATSYKSMAAMRKLQPKVSRLKEQYKDDKQGMSKAMMELYKKEKINPLGGCLPILVQIPVFIALYYVLLESVELRQAPFIFWIYDLSARDPYFILPILMGITMYLQQKLSPAPPDPTQAKMMMFLPIVMTVFFLNFPAGLVLYWFVNNLVSVWQQWYITKRYMDGKYDKKKKKK